MLIQHWVRAAMQGRITNSLGRNIRSKAASTSAASLFFWVSIAPDPATILQLNPAFPKTSCAASERLGTLSPTRERAACSMHNLVKQHLAHNFRSSAGEGLARRDMAFCPSGTARDLCPQARLLRNAKPFTPTNQPLNCR